MYLPGLLTSSYKTDRSIIVDWGDGTVETAARSSEISGRRHEVTKEGLYTVSLTYSDDMVLAIDADDYNDPHFFCSYVTEATLDENIALTDYALSGCPQLTKVTMLGATPPKLWEHTLTQNANLTAIYVPFKAVNTYKTAAVWSTFADIIRGYFPMKEVTSGAHYTTVEVDTAEAVKFSFPSTSLSVEAVGGDITVALTDTAQAGDDETITVPDGESRMFIHHRMNIDTYYLTGSGTATLYASNMGDVNPFKTVKRGGDGGDDNTHYKGTTTTALENGSTTNPIIIDGESYTAIFGDVVVYGYTEFVFDGTAWSEFGRPFDTVPTQGSTNAVISDGVYRNTAGRKYFVNNVLKGEVFNNSNNKAGGNHSHAEGDHTTASGHASHAEGQNTVASGDISHAEGYYTIASGTASSAGGFYTIANKSSSTAIGKYNVADTNVTHLLIVGNGTADARSNILEVSETDMNVNGDIQINNVAIPIPYATMPTITESMLGKIAMYVGATGNGYTQGCFYVAATDGAAEPTYSWVRIGGRRTETVLWENDGTTNPDTITLSEAWSDFDELVIATIASGGVAAQYETTKHTSAMAIGGIYTLWYNSDSTWGTYSATSSTVFTKASDGGVYYISKIIGIKY